MRLTRQSSYAIRTLIYCAVNDPKLSRIADIAKAHAISELFLFKLIKPLVEAGLLQTVRGRKGGIKLGRPANEITLLDTVKLTEENFAMAECFEGGGSGQILVDGRGLVLELGSRSLSREQAEALAARIWRDLTR